MRQISLDGSIADLEAVNERAAEGDHAEREDMPTARGACQVTLEHLFIPTTYRGEVVGVQTPGWPAAKFPHVATWDHDAQDGPVRILGIGSGYGAWESEVRAHFARLGILVHITALEIYAPREKHLRKWADEVIIGDAIEFLRSTDRVWDFGIGNTWFTGLVAKPNNGEPHAISASLPAILTKRTRGFALMHTVNAFTRGPEGRAVWRAFTPAATLAIPGTISFDGTSSSAADCYAVSVWIPGHQGGTTRTLLDVEPSDWNRAHGILKRSGEPYSCWRWSVGWDDTQARYGIPPGSEEPCEDYPAAPGWVR